MSSHPAHPVMPDKDERLEKMAQEMHGKPLSELSPEERIKVGGAVGGKVRGGEMAEPELAPPPPEVKFAEKNE